MADFGPTSVASSSEFNYNAPPFLMSGGKHEPSQLNDTSVDPTKKSVADYGTDPTADILGFATSKNSGNDGLDDSKDSDEGFSSSFSPTSETQQLDQNAGALWGNNNRGEDFFLPGFSMSAANVASPLLHSSAINGFSNSTGRGGGPAGGAAPSPLGQVRRPTPALSSYLASNKAMANALGVSGWPAQNTQTPQQQQQPQQQQPPQQSAWPTSQAPIGSNNNSFQPQQQQSINQQQNSWNGNNNNTISSNMSKNMQLPGMQQRANGLPPQPQHQNPVAPKGFPHPADQFQQSMNSVQTTIQAKNLKNQQRSFQSPLPMNNNMTSLKTSSPFSTSSSTSGISSMSSISNLSGSLDASNIVDDITQLTNSFAQMNNVGGGGSGGGGGHNHHHNHTVNNNHHHSNGLFPNQDKRMEEGTKYSSLESRLLGDVFKSTLDSDTYDSFRYNQMPKKSYQGRDHDQIVPSIGSSLNGSPRSDLDFGIERYSRKVFVGGLPPDIDEDEIHASFCRFGPLTVDWPHKAESKSYFPPKGYAFLLYKDEISVQRLIECCIVQDGKLYLCVSSPTIKEKPVQIRPWNLGDADFVMDGSQPLDPRKTIFVGGVPRPLRAVELAMIMDRLYGGVCYSGIDVDPELKYPKGAGRVAFSNQQSYIAAISARFIQLQHGEIDKRVEVKPYVLDDQMCDECHGVRCNGKFAPFFCSNITCLQYYCEQCWAIIHSRPGREFHKPLVKEGGDRPRHNNLGFRWPLKTHHTISSMPTMPMPSMPSMPLLP